MIFSFFEGMLLDTMKELCFSAGNVNILPAEAFFNTHPIGVTNLPIATPYIAEFRSGESQSSFFSGVYRNYYILKKGVRNFFIGDEQYEN